MKKDTKFGLNFSRWNVIMQAGKLPRCWLAPYRKPWGITNNQGYLISCCSILHAGLCFSHCAWWLSWCLPLRAPSAGLAGTSGHPLSQESKALLAHKGLPFVPWPERDSPWYVLFLVLCLSLGAGFSLGAVCGTLPLAGCFATAGKRFQESWATASIAGLE